MASENVPSPVRLSRPTKMSAPTPEASSPGSSTRPIVGPPSPDASISRNAPVMGDPSRVLMAAKLPAAPSTLTPCSGTGRRRAALVASTARPLPRAISGISGPITVPKASDASAAQMTPGSWIGVGGGCTAKPGAGDAPPLPGRYRIASAASTAPITSIGSGHQAGAVL